MILALKIIVAIWLLGNIGLLFHLGLGRSRAFWKDMFHRANEPASTPHGHPVSIMHFNTATWEFVSPDFSAAETPAVSR
jgi:hypothetical protein